MTSNARNAHRFRAICSCLPMGVEINQQYAKALAESDRPLPELIRELRETARKL